jgi:hypothetical protein
MHNNRYEKILCFLGMYILSLVKVFKIRVLCE